MKEVSLSGASAQEEAHSWGMHPEGLAPTRSPRCPYPDGAKHKASLASPPPPKHRHAWPKANHREETEA